MSKPKNQIIILKKTYIEKLFDNINGGDCVDSASIAEGLCADLLDTLAVEHATVSSLALDPHFYQKKAGDCKVCKLIAKAEGRK